jgi:hypothetical protein
VGAGAVPSFGIEKDWEARLVPCAATSLPRKVCASGQSQLTVKRAFLHHARNPAPPAWSRVPQANQAAGPWVPSAIWGGRSSADTIGHFIAERLPEIDMQPACPCQCSPATGTTKHDMGPARMHAASTSASAEVTQPTGSTLAEIAAISTSHSPGTAHTHTISLTHRRLRVV